MRTLQEVLEGNEGRGEVCVGVEFEERRVHEKREGGLMMGDFV